MFVNIENSIKKRKLIYNYSFWDNFWVLITPIFVCFLTISCGVIVLNEGIKRDKTEFIVYSIIFLLIVGIVIVAYFFIDKLSEIKGKSCSNNVKLIREFIKESGFEFDNQKNKLFSVSIPVRKYNPFNTRYLTIIIESETILYNCTTFLEMSASGIYFTEFRTPLAWFINKKYERKFRKYINKQL